MSDKELIEKLRDLGQRSSNQFEFYADSHRAKKTKDADQKAAINVGYHYEWEELLKEVDEHLGE